LLKGVRAIPDGSACVFQVAPARSVVVSVEAVRNSSIVVAPRRGVLDVVPEISVPWQHEIRLPTLIISGADDPLVPLKKAYLLADRIPNASEGGMSIAEADPIGRHRC